MACFAVPMVEAVVVTTIACAIRYKEKSKKEIAVNKNKAGADAAEETKISISRKLAWLARLLWGGSFLLAYEHLWHGEVVPWFPFLTAAGNPTDTAGMFAEISTAGVAMALLVTLVWAGIVVVSNMMIKKVLMEGN